MTKSRNSLPMENCWPRGGSEGSDFGEFLVPTGIAVDTEGSFFVSEVDNSRVQMFDSSGQFIEELATGLFARPHGMTFDDTGALYVADTGGNVVRKFRHGVNVAP